MEPHFSAVEAASELGISVPTLYAYVSRGILRSTHQPGTRRRRYLREDVWLLKQQRAHRRDPVASAADVLHSGLPTVSSRLTMIRDGRLYYRGRDAVALATTATLEEVAALLWLGDLSAPLPDVSALGSARDWGRWLRLTGDLPALERFQVFLPRIASTDPGAYDTQPHSVTRAGVRALRGLAAVAADQKPSNLPVAAVLAQAWGIASKPAARLIQAALVLYADNGLNPSSFTARCAASAGSTPYSVLTAGLCALQGTKHGGACERAVALLQEIEQPRDARRVIESRLRRGESLPGFGHPLYPEGDPRGALLIDLTRSYAAKSRDLGLALALCDTARELTQLRPNVDLGVVIACRALGFPASAPLALLGIARTVGWIAHALEQYAEGRAIRPRARYLGEFPAPVGDQAAGRSL